MGLFVAALGVAAIGKGVEYFSSSGRRKRGGGGGSGGAGAEADGSFTGGSSVDSAQTPVGVGGQYGGQPRGEQPIQTPGGSAYDKGSNNNLASMNSASNEDIVVSAAMQQLRDPGVLIVAHGSRGKPKTVRLVLTETAITWRTDMLKLGKFHQVSLSHIMYVDIGKQTTALRRVENASVSQALCFSLLTKEGSLDLEANSPRERDALVQCFSLVLDEVHAQNWRDVYRGPSSDMPSDMPSSFDEGDANGNGGGGMV